MKSKILIIIILSVLIGRAFAGSPLHSIYLFAKQNYYTSEHEACVVCVLPGIDDYKSYRLQLLDNHGNSIQNSQFADSVLHINLLEHQLQLGNNRFVVQIYKQQQLVKDTAVDVIRLTPVSNEVKIDRETGGLIVDNLPFFPFGFYCERVGKIPEQEIVNGFNFIGPYQNNLPEGLSERKAYMDRCAQLGMKVQYGLNSLVGNGHNGDKGLDKTEEEKLALLKSEILAFKEHPALLSWYINDEPDGQGRSPEMLEKAYNLIHELDPYHPISIVFMMPSKFHEFGKTMDIAMTDPYPIPRSIDIRDYIVQMNHDFRYQKSIWLVPQAFGGQEMWSRESTPKEIRVMTYLGLLEGVKGVQYFIRLGNNLAPQSVGAWSECSNMALEVTQMTPFLLSGEKSEIVPTDNPFILAKYFTYKGNRLLIVVNKANRPSSFAVDIEQPKATHVDVWFENRQVELKESHLSDMIDALGTRVYLLKENQDKNQVSVYPGNIVYNPGFEEVPTPGLAAGQGRVYSHLPKQDWGATLFTDSRQSKEGLFSLRMITPADSAGKTVHLLPIILKAGDTYNLSVWAKALPASKMPRLRVAINTEKYEQCFQIGSEWKKYSYVFKATTSSTNAIVDLELLDKGTAWIDLIQVVADPVARYELTPDRKARVFISTISDSTQVKYSLSGEAKEMNYTGPFQVDKAVNVKALLFNNKRKLAESTIFVPVNKALGKPVHFETQYHEQYQSAGSATLTDGIMGTTLFRDKKWLGFLQPEVIFTVDMQQLEEFRSVVVNCLSDANSGIFLPRKISISVSDDGIKYREVGVNDTIRISKRGEPSLVSLEVPTGNRKARYIRFTIQAFGTIPEGYLFKGSTSWLFMDEVLVQ